MNAHYREELGIDYEKVGNTQEHLGDINGALDSYRNELRIFEEQSVTDPANAQFHSDLSSGLFEVAGMLARTGEAVAALANSHRALEIRRGLATADPINLWKRWDLITSSATTSKMLAQAGNSKAALDIYREAAALLASTTDDPTNVLLGSYRANAYSEVGESLQTVAAGRTTAAGEKHELLVLARSLFQRSLDVFQDMRTKANLSSVDSSKVEKVTGAIAECNHLLSFANGER